MVGGTISAGVLGTLFQSLISHHFKPGDYGAIFAAMSMLATIGIPAGALTLLMARETSRDEAESRGDRSAAMLRIGNRWLLAAGAVCALFVVQISSQLGSFFSAPSSFVIAASAGIPFTLALPVLLGELQGQQRFVAFSVLTSGQAGLKVVGAFALGWLLGPVGVLGGISLATALTYVVARALIRHAPRSAESRLEWMRIAKYLAIVLPGTIGLAVLLSTDVLLVKHFFSQQQAGRYAVIAALGRAIFWGATGTAAVLFPKLVFRETKGSSGTRLVRGSLLLVALAGTLGVLALTTWAEPVVSLFAGAQYVEAASYLPWYAVGMTLLGAAYVLVATYQSRGDARFLFVLIPLVVLEPMGIIAFHRDPLQVVQVMDLTMAVLVFGLSGLSAIREPRRSAESASGRPLSGLPHYQGMNRGALQSVDEALPTVAPLKTLP
jgi:O-antigen/teichoic acid export membrane protein